MSRFPRWVNDFSAKTPGWILDKLSTAHSVYTQQSQAGLWKVKAIIKMQPVDALPSHAAVFTFNHHIEKCPVSHCLSLNTRLLRCHRFCPLFTGWCSPGPEAAAPLLTSGETLLHTPLWVLCWAVWQISLDVMMGCLPPTILARLLREWRGERREERVERREERGESGEERGEGAHISNNQHTNSSCTALWGAKCNLVRFGLEIRSMLIKMWIIKWTVLCGSQLGRGSVCIQSEGD